MIFTTFFMIHEQIAILTIFFSMSFNKLNLIISQNNSNLILKKLLVF